MMLVLLYIKAHRKGAFRCNVWECGTCGMRSDFEKGLVRQWESSQWSGHSNISAWVITIVQTNSTSIEQASVVDEEQVTWLVAHSTSGAHLSSLKTWGVSHYHFSFGEPRQYVCEERGKMWLVKSSQDPDWCCLAYHFYTESQRSQSFYQLHHPASTASS